jgi:hypothetical protein
MVKMKGNYTMIKVPRLAKGKGYKGPEFYGCFNTGMAPAIFHSHTGKFIVGPELRCRSAMRNCLLLTDKRSLGEGRDKVWILKTRSPAVAKFMALCGAVILENDLMRLKHVETIGRAAKGDLAAALALEDF